MKTEEETYHYTQPGAEIFNACEIDADYDLYYGNMGYQVPKERIKKNWIDQDIVLSCQKMLKSDFQSQFWCQESSDYFWII